MKFQLFSLAVVCIIGLAQARLGGRTGGFPPESTGPTFPRPPSTHRFRREPQGSIQLQGSQPLGGPDRHPSFDVNYQQRLINSDRTKLDAFGGANFYRGHVTPNLGVGVEHRFRNNMFINGQGQVQPGLGGRLSPSVGAGFGWRFRRDAPEDPQGSIVLQGNKPLSGSDRHTSIDLNYQQRIINNDRTKLDAFGGANIYRGQITPHAGVGIEHRFPNNMFINGQGQVQPGPGGRLSPSFGAGLGWRFRREALPYEEEEIFEREY